MSIGLKSCRFPKPLALNLFIAVSYTHLDSVFHFDYEVVILETLGNVTKEKDLKEFDVQGFAHPVSLDRDTVQEAVSYTHLDVYKRQFTSSTKYLPTFYLGTSRSLITRLSENWWSSYQVRLKIWKLSLIHIYLEAIAETNAGTATVLQYLCPVGILAYTCIIDLSLIHIYQSRPESWIVCENYWTHLASPTVCL